MKRLTQWFMLLLSPLTCEILHAGNHIEQKPTTTKRIPLSQLKNYRLVLNFEQAEFKRQKDTQWQPLQGISPIELDYKNAGKRLKIKKGTATMRYTLTHTELLDITAPQTIRRSVSYKTKLNYKNAATKLEFLNMSLDEEGGDDIYLILHFDTPTTGTATGTIYTYDKPQLRNVRFNFEP